MMKVTKLDRRYAGFPKWKYMIQFPLRGREKHRAYIKYSHAFSDIYGDYSTINPDRKALDYSKPVWLYNENWYADFKRQRILFNDPSVVTMITLKITE